MPRYRIRQGTNFTGTGRVWRVERRMFMHWAMIWYYDTLPEAQLYVGKITGPMSNQTFYYDEHGAPLKDGNV